MARFSFRLSLTIITKSGGGESTDGASRVNYYNRLESLWFHRTYYVGTSWSWWLTRIIGRLCLKFPTHVCVWDLGNILMLAARVFVLSHGPTSCSEDVLKYNTHLHWVPVTDTSTGCSIVVYRVCQYWSCRKLKW